jgi:probable HAF family extracellular repeat protein
LGGHFSQARAINDRGEVVGISSTGQSTHAFLWRDGRMSDLGTLGGRHSAAFDINNRGEVVGYSETAGGQWHAFLWRDGRMRDLGTLGGAGGSSIATAINDRGDIVGDNDGPSGLQAFLWRDGRMSAVEADLARPAGINERGDIIGTSYAGGQLTAILWSDGHATAVGEDYGVAINNRGQVLVGTANLWHRGQITPITGPAGATSVAVAGLNEHATVVGSSDLGAFVWNNGRAILLPRFATDTVAGARDINNRGQIVGASGTDEPLAHAVLWTR